MRGQVQQKEQDGSMEMSTCKASTATSSSMPTGTSPPESNSTPTMYRDIDKAETFWRNVKKYRRVTYVTFALSSAILMYGYETPIVGSVSGMPAFQRDFGKPFGKNRYILPATWLSIWLTASPLGAMLGSLAGAWFQDRHGRRLSLAISAFISTLGVAMMYISSLSPSLPVRRTLFLIGKLVQGLAIGTNITTAQTYLSEILPPCLRGSGMAFFPLFSCAGQLTGALVIYTSLGKPRGYTVAFASQWPFSFLPILVAWWMPESPTWYMRKGRIEDARRALRRLAPIDDSGKDEVDTTVEKLALVVAKEKEIAATTSIRQCFDKTNLRRTMIVLWAQSLQAIWGLPLLSKSSYFLQLVGMDADKSIVFLILGIVLGLLGNMGGIWLSVRVGRRKLVMWTLAGAGGLWACMGIANCFKGTVVVWYSAASMMVVITLCGLGVWPAGYAVASEASSLRLRARTNGLGWTVNAFSVAVSQIVLPYMYNPDAGNLRGKTTFVYAATCVVGVVVSWLIMPEMKGRGVAEVDEMFERRVGTRDFEKWKGTADVEDEVKV